ncbi:MAG: RNA polymerase-binding protein DksA [Gammaproteobacteria bacterium]|nr:RNA polymerase-binding protein DksA [Gammaproteobacteria bacterium]
MAVKKAVSKKKAAPAKKKAAAPKKKAPVKKKAIRTKKKAAAPKKKAAAPKKKAAAPKKKAAAPKKKAAAPKKKAAAPKKKAAAPKKKAAAPKKASSSASAVKKKIIAKKPVPKPKTRLIPDEPIVGMTLPVEGIDPYMPSNGELYMSDGQLVHFRHILLEWKKQLMQEVDRTVDHMKTDAANYADPADRATQEEEFSLELRTRDRERKLIKKIDESVITLDTGDYGYCESCGIEIGIRRLEARPTATQCIDCKTLQEIKEKQIYS